MRHCWFIGVAALASVGAVTFPGPLPWSFPSCIEIVANPLPITSAADVPQAVLFLPGGRVRYGGRFEEMLAMEVDSMFLETAGAGEVS